jgi:hypothetical protein
VVTVQEAVGLIPGVAVSFEELIPGSLPSASVRRDVKPSSLVPECLLHGINPPSPLHTT